MTTWAVAERWVRDCISGHAQCRARRSEPSWHPTRLIQLVGSGGHAGTVVSCHLVDGSALPSSEAYATLSHRWQGVNVLTLTTGNMDSLKQNIPMTDLSLTFRQAMTVVLRLGLRFVWIDSLCILQDGDGGHDWENEATLMSKVYTHSFCNISADWGSETDGLFFKRGLAQFEQIEVALRIRRNGSESVENYTSVDSSLWTDEIMKSPLSSRGWVLQERFLAPRNLRFGRREIFWECCETAACETYPDGIPSMSCFYEAKLKALQNFGLRGPNYAHLQRQRSESADPEIYYQLWDQVVSQYSTCSLTFPSDKLVAISGVARFLKPLLNDVYILGNWSKAPSIQLLWFHMELDEPLEPLYPPSQYSCRAPTFSWASSNRAVGISDREESAKALSTVKFVYYRPATHSRADEDVEVLEDIYGPVDTPTVELKVSGYLRRMTLQAKPNRETGLLAVPWDADRSNDEFEEIWIDGTDSNRINPPQEGEDFYYMPWVDNPTEEDQSLSCLVLRLADRDMGRFTRMGIMFTTEGNIRDQFLKSQAEDSLPCWSYDSRLGLHTIYVV